MGKFEGEILLAEKKVRALRKQLRRDKNIRPSIKPKLDLVFKMALRYIKWTTHFERFVGRYEEYYPSLARGICETFYTDDSELAACFRTTPAMIYQWQRWYPDFKKQIHKGRRCFAQQGGSRICCRRWFRRKLAGLVASISKEFSASRRQLLRCFEPLHMTATKLDNWSLPDRSELERIQDRMFAEVVGRICAEFKPNDEQLARCLDIDVETLKRRIQSDYEFSTEVRLGRMDGSGETAEMMDGFERFLSGETEHTGEVRLGRMDGSGETAEMMDGFERFLSGETEHTGEKASNE